MSYDISITGPVCVHCNRADADDEVGNMTANIGDMFRLAMPGPYPGGGRYNGVGDSEPRGGLPGLSGLKCTDAAPILRAGIAAMVARADEMCALEPANGWGSYDGACGYLARILAACEARPDGVLSVSW